MVGKLSSSSSSSHTVGMLSSACTSCARRNPHGGNVPFGSGSSPRLLTFASLSLLFPLSQRNMDMSKFVLCFLILFNIPGSDRGGGVLNNVASGTIISISTAKGSVIIGADGQLPPSGAANPGPSSTGRRWNHYETALSNTGHLGLPDGVTAATTSATPSTPPAPTTNFPSTEDMEPFSVLDSTEGTQTPLSSPSNKTSFQVSFDNKNLLNNARKYIASYEDLQSRFPDGSPFENNTHINMTVPLGDTAFLRCRVRNLGERSISWVRKRDYHILTTGKTTYTNDERFNVLHVDGTEDWTLQIKFVQKRDNGTYECQVSTGTGIISYFVNLFIAVPEAFILGNGEYHVEQGSSINLVCVIEKSPKPPEFIFWYHNERMINYGNSREVVVRTEPGARTHSRLTIKDARIPDSGNYTCSTPHAEAASILVYVSQASGLFSGDKMAAIQRRKTTGSTSISSSPSESSAPIASSPSSAAAVIHLTTVTTFPATTALAITVAMVGAIISSIQLSSSLGRNYYQEKSLGRSVISPRNKISSGDNCTGKFLLTLSLLLGERMRDLLVQLLLPLLFLPILLLLAVGTEIAHFILVKVEPFIVLVVSRWRRGSEEAPQEANDETSRHTHSPHYYPDYCSPANNPLRNPIEQQHPHHQHHYPHQQKLFGGGAEEVQQQWELSPDKKLHNSEEHGFWWQFQNGHFVILVRRIRLLLFPNPDPVSSSSSSSSSPRPSPSSMKKSLPVFPSIAQSLWDLVSSGFSKFLPIVLLLEIAIKGLHSALFLGRMMKEEETGKNKERSQSQRPLFLFRPSNRLGFRTISHLLIFPARGPLQHLVEVEPYKM